MPIILFFFELLRSLHCGFQRVQNQFRHRGLAIRMRSMMPTICALPSCGVPERLSTPTSQISASVCHRRLTSDMYCEVPPRFFFVQRGILHIPEEPSHDNSCDRINSKQWTRPNTSSKIGYASTLFLSYKHREWHRLLRTMNVWEWPWTLQPQKLGQLPSSTV